MNIKGNILSYKLTCVFINFIVQKVPQGGLQSKENIDLLRFTTHKYAMKSLQIDKKVYTCIYHKIISDNLTQSFNNYKYIKFVGSLPSPY